MDGVSALLDDWMERTGLDRPNRIRVRLAMEELLLRVSERFSGEIPPDGDLRHGQRGGLQPHREEDALPLCFDNPFGQRCLCGGHIRFFFPLESGATAMDGSQTKQLLQMVFDILPSNPVKPFYDGNSLQILFLAAFLGVLLLMLGSRTEGLQSLAVQCNVLVMRAVEIVCVLLPLFIFSSLTLMFWENGMQAILRLWKPLAVCAMCAHGFITAGLAAASIRLRVSPMLLARKLWPAFLVGITTASSSAAMGLVLEINEKSWASQMRSTSSGSLSATCFILE